jgi:hypothetical protein
MPTSQSVVIVVCGQPTLDTFNPLRETTNWRAVWGKTARTVLREGSLAQPDFPTPIVERLSQSFIALTPLVSSDLLDLAIGDKCPELAMFLTSSPPGTGSIC